MSDIKVSELDLLCEQMSRQREAIDQIAKEKKLEDGKLAEMEKKFLALLLELDKTSWASKVGNFGITHRLSVKLPQTPEAKTEFFDYLREKGIFEQMVSVNSNTLNSFYKKELELAQERGEGMDFQLPGIEPPTVSETISFRSKA